LRQIVKALDRSSVGLPGIGSERASNACRRGRGVMGCTMRTELVLALTATLLLSVPFARADVRCFDRWIPAVPNGITYADGHTRAGQPCQAAFGLAGANIEVLRVTVRPLHGVLGASAKEGNRRYIAYAPSVGFVGRDRFELYIQYMPPVRSSFTTRFKVEMNVTP
jgi:hypothetical protein